MSKITLIHADSANCCASADLIFTDPPYEMPGSQLASIIKNYNSPHIILITTMSQLIDFTMHSDFALSFDFVLDATAPKKSNSIKRPHYTHHTGVYMHKKNISSVFNRKLRQRSDVFNLNYWPTIFHAPKENRGHGMEKNIDAITDLLGSFSVNSVIDPFAGSGTTGIAAHSLDITCTLIEKDIKNIELIRKNLRFIGA